MSFYVGSDQIIEHGKPFGQHHRATVFNGSPDYAEIISIEVSGRNIKRVENTHEERGKVLMMGTFLISPDRIDADGVLVSASPGVRDQLKKLAHRHLEQKITSRFSTEI
ncbi:hypothetical protein N7466_011140 [Penicillium verhagenii]|uniref:uncharacterized protein n=1 Tax=Penicillium verhagenii TaxID=1562060 RepID=UPI0025455768|nr:uncharacterized protein N7466_011140 [Penicillium verhagenii]KAJ5917586.1 hypothetical protein N7466_011140 [Penicillium verhagenii]